MSTLYYVGNKDAIYTNILSAMGARRSQKQSNRWYKKSATRSVYNEEVRASLDNCVGMQDCLSNRYSGLRVEIEETEIELKMANAILEYITKRLSDRQSIIKSIQNQINYTGIVCSPPTDGSKESDYQ